jgi:hypothetical protein
MVIQHLTRQLLVFKEGIAPRPYMARNEDPVPPR